MSAKSGIRRHNRALWPLVTQSPGLPDRVPPRTASNSVTVSTTAAVSAAATTATISMPAATAAARALFAWPGDIDVQRTPSQFLPVQGVNGLLRLFRRTHCYEGEAARAATDPVGHKVGFNDSAVGGEASCKSFSLTLKSRFPTNNLVLIVS